jgi:hypothetical protein
LKAENPDDEHKTSFENEKIGKDEYREVIAGGDEEAESPEALEFKKKEVRLVKKLDVFIAPVMFLLMLISYLDRGNIGFAATQGMIEEIHLEGSDLNVSILNDNPLLSVRTCIDLHLIDCGLHILYNLYPCRGT